MFLQLIYYIGRGYFLTGHSDKGYQFQNVGHTVQGKFCGPLFTHRYTVDQKAHTHTHTHTQTNTHARACVNITWL